MAALGNVSKNMSTRVFSDSAKKQKGKISKLLLDGFDSLQTKWPEVSEEDSVKITDMLVEFFQKSGFRFLTCKEKLLIKKEEVYPEQQEKAERLRLCAKSFRSLKKELVVGINEVTKGLERNTLSLVIADRSTKPISMISHLPRLADFRNVPIAALEFLTTVLGTKIGVKSLIAIGFKKDSPLVKDLVVAVLPIVSKTACLEPVEHLETVFSVSAGSTSSIDLRVTDADGFAPLAQTVDTHLPTSCETVNASPSMSRRVHQRYQGLKIKSVLKNELRHEKVKERKKARSLLTPKRAVELDDKTFGSAKRKK